MGDSHGEGFLPPEPKKVEPPVDPTESDITEAQRKDYCELAFDLISRVLKSEKTLEAFQLADAWFPSLYTDKNGKKWSLPKNYLEMLKVIDACEKESSKEVKEKALKDIADLMYEFSKNNIITNDAKKKSDPRGYQICLKTKKRNWRQ